MRDHDVPALRADRRVNWTRDVLRFSDTDQNGHVNNTVFSALCESGRVNLLRSVLGPTREPGRYFVIARLVIEFRGELLFPGTVSSGTWITRVGATSVRFGQVLVDERDRVAAVSEAVTVSMDGATRRPAPLGDATRSLALSLLRAGED